MDRGVSVAQPRERVGGVGNGVGCDVDLFASARFAAHLQEPLLSRRQTVVVRKLQAIAVHQVAQHR
eukprot:1969773-Pleurochrysis_carterae.AAC.1